jgi:glyoxylase-like metal-dependent hydrolase (beta-lactamase superfamily II)
LFCKYTKSHEGINAFSIFVKTKDMTTVQSFTFNPFQENTYVLFDESKECVIIDPGCFDESERKRLCSFIEEKKLRPVKLLNTHGHIDHVVGNKFVAETYQLGLEIHQKDLPVLLRAVDVASMYGFTIDASPEPSKFIDEKDSIQFGNASLSVLFVPGHSPGSVCFYNKEEKFIIGGDVLFQNSIGRTDLPGGDFNTLIHGIRTKLFTLQDDVKVYPGHGPSTTIGHEKKYNPFLQ